MIQGVTVMIELNVQQQRCSGILRNKLMIVMKIIS